MGKGRTGESIGAITANVADLDRQNAQLRQTRKDLGRFLDIDREKSELSSLIVKKIDAQKEVESIVKQGQAQAEQIKVNSRAAGDAIILKAKEEAALIVQKSIGEMNKVTERKAELDKKQAEIAKQLDSLSKEKLAFSEEKNKLATHKGELKNYAISLTESLKKLL